MALHPNKKQQTLDPEAAALMLENIFDACQVQPNTVPLVTLTSYSNYRKNRYVLQKVILGIMFALFLLVPMLFIPPKVGVVMLSSEVSNQYDPVFEVTVKSAFMPVKRVVANVNGRNVPVYEVAERIYQVEPNMNGTLNITVTLANNQSEVYHTDITAVDVDAPQIIGNGQSGKDVLLYVEDTSSGVDFEKVYGIDGNGNHIAPLSWNEETGEVVFHEAVFPMEIFIPDHASNTLRLVLTQK